MKPDQMALRDLKKLDVSESLMRDVLFAPEVNRWWPDVVPELLIALASLEKARQLLSKPIEVKDE